MQKQFFVIYVRNLGMAIHHTYMHVAYAFSILNKGEMPCSFTNLKNAAYR